MRFRATLLFALLAGVLATAANCPAASPGRLNFLVLLTDDQRVDTIGAMGNPSVHTPHLDELVRRGFVFRNAYCQGSSVPAVCVPSRNMLLSGQSYFRWQGGPYAAEDGPCLPAELNAAGYQTWYHGKRGNTAPKLERQFEINAQLADDERERSAGRPGQTIADQAVAFIQKRNDPRPFCMWLSFEAPHDPRVAAAEDLDRYDPASIPLPTNYMPLHPFDNGEMLVRDERLASWPRTEEEVRRHQRDYWAVVTGLDRNIGRVLQSLRDAGESDNTIVIFTSDHGLAVGSHGLMGKQNLYEHSMRVPLVFAGPGIPAGGCDALVYLYDLFPTICELAGAPPPAGMDGRSLAGIISGRSESVRDTLFLSYRDVQRAVRDDRWKLIRYPQVNVTQLFDLQDDPRELHDLAGDPAQAKRIDDLLAIMSAWQRDLGDTAPLFVDNPRDPAFVPPP